LLAPSLFSGGIELMKKLIKEHYAVFIAAQISYMKSLTNHLSQQESDFVIANYETIDSEQSFKTQTRSKTEEDTILRSFEECNGLDIVQSFLHLNELIVN
jgi:hypothetical protein